VGITVGSIATLRPLFKHIREKTRSLSSRNRGHSVSQGPILRSVYMIPNTRNLDEESEGNLSPRTESIVEDLRDERHESEHTEEKHKIEENEEGNEEGNEERNDIDGQFRAYGMSDFGTCITVQEEDFVRTEPDQELGRSGSVSGRNWHFGSLQRASMTSDFSFQDRRQSGGQFD
jgi:hypothetical protein